MKATNHELFIENPLKNSSRIIAFDFLRGMAILIIIFVHRIHYTWTGMENGDILDEYFEKGGFGVIIVILTIGLFMMAGVFYVVSSTVNTFNYYKRIQQNQANLKKYTLIGIKSGIWLIILNYFQRIFFMNGFTNTESLVEPEYPVGILTSLLKYEGNFTWFWSIITKTGTLFVLGINLVIISGILFIIFKNNLQQDPKKPLRYLYILGILFFILSPFVKFWGTPFYEQLYSDGHILFAFLIGGITTEFSLFPYLSFGLFGSYFGLLIASTDNKVEISKKFKKSILIWFIIGAIGVVIFDSDTVLGDRLMKTAINCVGVALFLLFEFISLKIYDFSSKRKQLNVETSSNPVIIFGKISLTIFILEPILAELLIISIDVLFGSSWKANLWHVGLFAIVCILFWMILAIIWKKLDFKGSFEWISKKMLKKPV